MTETVVKATDKRNQPDVTVYAYDIRALAAGYEVGWIRRFAPHASSDTLKRARALALE